MAVASSVLVKKVHLAAAKFCTLFRVNNGTGWLGSGKPIRVSQPTKVLMMPGDILLRGPCRPLKAGLENGSGDLIGWKSEIITAEMVGERFARLVSIEVKYGSGRPSPDQLNWAYQLTQAGAIAGIVYNEDQAVVLVK